MDQRLLEIRRRVGRRFYDGDAVLKEVAGGLTHPVAGETLMRS